MQRFSKFIEEVLLARVLQNIVIFIDEIDRILSLPFKVDGFFAVIRECCNKRVDNPAYRRLTFVLLGVATPSDLIRDKRSTPFNIGHAIELSGFRLQEAQPLVQGLTAKTENPEVVLRTILEWTGGQPFLTQKICQLITMADSSAPAGEESAWVERLIQSQIIDNWVAHDEPEHLKTIRDRLLCDTQQKGRLLGLYRQVLEQDNLEAIDQPEQMKLRLAGIVVKRAGQLQVFNRVYAAVFNLAWVEQQMAGLRPYAEAISAWLASNCGNEASLLRGQVLRDALDWAADKSLSDDDRLFLQESQKADQRDVELKLAVEQEAKQTLEEANRKARQLLWISSSIAAVFLGIATLAGLIAHKIEKENQATRLKREEAEQKAFIATKEANETRDSLINSTINSKLDEAKELATNGEIEKAVTIYKEAQVSYLGNDLDLDPDTEVLETNPESLARKLATDAKLSEGQRLAALGAIDVAISAYREAQSFNPGIDLDLNPDTDVLETDPKSLARKLAAPAALRQGKKLLNEGRIERAISAYQEAQELDPNLKISVRDWHSLCWNGGLSSNYTDKVLDACEEALALEPQNGRIQDSRGLARARAGDFAGAIEDFNAYINLKDRPEKLKNLRRRWIELLEQGENPFTEEVLENLR